MLFIVFILMLVIIVASAYRYGTDGFIEPAVWASAPMLILVAALIMLGHFGLL